METLTVTPFQFAMKPSHKPYTPPRFERAPAVLDFSAPSTKMTIHNAARSELLCRYPSKLCDNLRSEKRGGGLHRFCALHRERANINQRRVDHRRRLRRRGGVVAPTDKLPSDHKDVHSSDEDSTAEDMVSLDMDSFEFDDACSIPLYSALSEDDLQVLIALLDDHAVKPEPVSSL